MTNEIPLTHVLSPSLTAKVEGATAYEVKFLLDETKAAEIKRWAARHLSPDPNGDPQQGGSYRITSLYTDTAGLDVYHRTPKFRRRKYRLRRYGDETTIHLERKIRKGTTVAKRRSSIPETALSLLSHPLGVTGWPGDWFQQSLLRKALLPSCQITYQRTAFLGSGSEGPLRLTLDRNLFGQRANDWTVETSESALPLAPGMVVLELKFRDAMPVLFKRLVAERQLSPSGFSKYRHCIDTFEPAVVAQDRGVKYA